MYANHTSIKKENKCFLTADLLLRNSIFQEKKKSFLVCYSLNILIFPHSPQTSKSIESALNNTNNIHIKGQHNGNR